MKTTRGLYIHIPFCVSKCTYCDFYSVSSDTEIMEKYVGALIKEIELVSLANKDYVIDTIYFGGGTPSVLPLYLLGKIVDSIYKNFKVKIEEFTIEANPATKLYFSDYINFGIDRVSLGVQTLNDDLLKIIGRRHTAKVALDTIDEAKKYFKKVSCDMMIGLPTQTIEDVENTAITLANKIGHISMYMLKLSNNVKMSKQIDKGIYCLPDDDQFVDFYDLAYNIFKSRGLNRYEISNFSLDGFESKHNLKYWNREEYIGLGASAHGFIDGYRYFNPSSLNDYIFGLNYGNGKVDMQFVGPDEALFEKIMLAFRLPSGINIQEINTEFNIDFEKKYHKQLEFLKPILVIEDNNIFINEDNTQKLLNNTIN